MQPGMTIAAAGRSPSLLFDWRPLMSEELRLSRSEFVDVVEVFFWNEFLVWIIAERAFEIWLAVLGFPLTFRIEHLEQDSFQFARNDNPCPTNKQLVWRGVVVSPQLILTCVPGGGPVRVSKQAQVGPKPPPQRMVGSIRLTDVKRILRRQ